MDVRTYRFGEKKSRLLGVDAPERKQPFGTRSKQSLSDLCGRKTATVEWTEKDRYGRVLGRVRCAGVDANAEQVRRGMAWVYKRYVKDRRLYVLQDEAKAARRGAMGGQVGCAALGVAQDERKHESKALAIGA